MSGVYAEPKMTESKAAQKARRKEADHWPHAITLRSMIKRCYYKGATGYENYGGRGIRVCARWQGPRGLENFIADMGPRPSRFHSIDRINNDGDYEPSNCRWATAIQQNNNKRPPKRGANRKRGESLDDLKAQVLAMLREQSSEPSSPSTSPSPGLCLGVSQ